MPRTLSPKKFGRFPSLKSILFPLVGASCGAPELISGSNRDLKMTFEDQLNVMVYFHLKDFQSGRHLLQDLQEDEFAKESIAPSGGVGKSTFFDSLNERGLEQFLHVFQNLFKQASNQIPKEFSELGDLVAIDGSLIDSVLSMVWADYRKGTKKAKVHVGFNVNCSIPQKIFLTEGNGAERPFAQKIVEPGQTGIMDRGYQSHDLFDQWQANDVHFVCRIKGNTQKTCIKELPFDPGGIVFYDAVVRLGQPGINETKKELRLVGYRVGNKKYWVATDRFDLTAEQIALIYKLRWNVESFFAWWKRHMRVYHLISRSKHGLMIQILSGLITYLLLAIYCNNEFGEKVNIKRVRELQIKIANEIRHLDQEPPDFDPEKDSLTASLSQANLKPDNTEIFNNNIDVIYIL